MIVLALPYPISGPGVYRIADSSSGRFYIGSSVNVAVRWGQHRRRMELGTHPNPRLQAIWNADPGRLSISTIRTVEAATRDLLLASEQMELNSARVGSNPDCMNVLLLAGSHLGRKRTEATKLALSLAQRGKRASDETRAKQRAAKLGKSQTLEHRQNSGNARRGRPGKPKAGIPKPSLRRLSDNQIKDLRADRASGASWGVLAAKFGLGKSATKRAAIGISYRVGCGK